MNVWSSNNEEHFRIDEDVLTPSSFFSWSVFDKAHTKQYYTDGEVTTIETTLDGDAIREWLPFATTLRTFIRDNEYPATHFPLAAVEAFIAPFLPTSGIWLCLCTGSDTEAYADIGEQVRKHYALVQPNYISALEEGTTLVHYNFNLAFDPVARLNVPSKNKLAALAMKELNVLTGVLHSAWLTQEGRSPPGVEVPWSTIDWSSLPATGYVRALHESGKKEASSAAVLTVLKKPGDPVALLEALKGSDVSGSFSLPGSVSQYNYNSLQTRFISFPIEDWGSLYTKVITYLSRFGTRWLKWMGLHPIVTLPPLTRVGETLTIFDCVAYTTIQCITASVEMRTLDPSRVAVAATRAGKKLGSTVLLALVESLVTFIGQQGEDAEEGRPEIFCDTTLKAVEEDKVPEHFSSLV